MLILTIEQNQRLLCKEAEMYDKMVCWCESNDKEKTKAIALRRAVNTARDESRFRILRCADSVTRPSTQIVTTGAELEHV